MRLTEELRKAIKGELKRRCPECGRHGMTYRELGESLEVNPSTLCRFVTGKGSPSGEVIDALYKRFGHQIKGG